MKIADITQITDEKKKALNFIEDWQSKNEYNPLFLGEYNDKFNKEFNHFLNNSNFSEQTINFFKTE